MAIYKIFPEKDATLYSEDPSSNTGLDEILEVGSYPKNGKNELKRSIIKFPTGEIKSIVDNLVGNSNYEANLKLNLSEAHNLPTSFNIKAYPLYKDWVNGSGKFGDIPTNTTGVSWNSVNGVDNWDSNATGSNVQLNYYDLTVGGGVWYTSYNNVNLESPENCSINHSLDLDFNVSEAVKLHYQNLSNYGYIIKLDSEYEDDSSYRIDLKYFSKESHTIYPPSLEIKWDDSEFNTGSLPEIDNANSKFIIYNNKGEFSTKEKYRFRIRCRPIYPKRNFSITSSYLKNYHLPINSYWGLKDESTEEMVFDFDDNYTKISTDENSSYFDLYMDGLQPERYYRILLKTSIDGSNLILDNDVVFKVVRNGK